MEILYITNGFPFPLTSGYLRHYHLLRGLAPRHKVTLLSVVGSGFDPDHRAALDPYANAIHTFGPAAGDSTLVKLARRAEGLAHTTASGPVDALRSTAATLVASGRFDAAVFSGKRTFPVLDALGALPVVVDLCDATSSRVRGGLRFGTLTQRAGRLFELVEVRRIERSLIRRGDHLVFASGRDRDLLMMGADQSRTTVVSNGVDLEIWTRNSMVLGGSAVVFSGKMDYPPNEHAALHLIEAVMPIVRRSVPDAELFIVGRDPTPRLMAAARSGTTVTGYVDDVRPYLERASVFAAPLHFGAGIQNKVLEAMAMAVPVVASSLAAEGVRAGDGSEAPVAVAEEPAAFAAEVVARLVAAGEGAAPDRAGRVFVERNFTWAENTQRLEGALEAAQSAWAARRRVG